MMFDEQEVLFRATWRPLHGFFNISLWRDGRVVETFHLTPEAASDLLSFVTRALVSSVPAPSSHLRVVPSSDSPRPRPSDWRVPARIRERLADSLESAAQRLRR